MISAYCLGYQHFTVIPHHMKEDFAEMTDMGFDAVCLSFSESEMKYSRRAFEIQVDMAKKAGLKVFVVPSRLGGRFAGAPLAPSLWLAANPEYAIQSRWMPVACLEAGEFRAWIKDFMKELLTSYDLDGIVWDEPKGMKLISNHPDTIAKYGPNPTESNMIDSFVNFLEELTTYCQSLKPGIIQTLFAQKTDSEEFTRKAARTKNIAYFGYDGNLARQSIFHEEPKWHKYRIESVWERTCLECQEAGKKTFALVENMLMPKAAIQEFKVNFERYLQDYHPDHLSIYYYAHNNEDPEETHKVIKMAMRKYLMK